MVYFIRTEQIINQSLSYLSWREVYLFLTFLFFFFKPYLYLHNTNITHIYTTQFVHLGTSQTFWKAFRSISVSMSRAKYGAV